MNHVNTVFRSLAVIEEKIHERLTVESLTKSLYFFKYHYRQTKTVKMTLYEKGTGYIKF